MILTFEQGLALSGVIISCFVAIGTLSLAFLAFRTLRKAARQDKNRQLDDIENWAENIKMTSLTDKQHERVKKSKKSDLALASWIVLSEYLELFRNLAFRGIIIQKIATTLKAQKLNEQIGELNDELKKHMEYIGDAMIEIDVVNHCRKIS